MGRALEAALWIRLSFPKPPGVEESIAETRNELVAPDDTAMMCHHPAMSADSGERDERAD
jgi:hypothetical protein